MAILHIDRRYVNGALVTEVKRRKFSRKLGVTNEGITKALPKDHDDDLAVSFVPSSLELVGRNPKAKPLGVTRVL